MKKLNKEDIYINLQGKSKEELTEIQNVLIMFNEPTYRKDFKTYYNSDSYNYLEFSDGEWLGSRTITQNKQEVTIQQLKEILQPMEKFTPIAMKCTQEQFEAVKPKLIGLKITDIECFKQKCYLVNNRFSELNITNCIEEAILYETNIHKEWNEEIFLKACGIEVENIQPMENKEFDLKGYSVEVDNEEQAKQLQELAFKKGFEWYNGKTLQRLNEKFFSFNAFNENEIKFDFKHFKDEYVTKEIHFNDIFKTEPTLEQQLEKAKAEVKRIEKEIEESKIKIGDWVVSELNDCVFRYQYGRLEEDLTKITDRELINKLNELIK